MCFSQSLFDTLRFGQVNANRGRQRRAATSLGLGLCVVVRVWHFGAVWVAVSPIAQQSAVANAVEVCAVVASTYSFGREAQLRFFCLSTSRDLATFAEARVDDRRARTYTPSICTTPIARTNDQRDLALGHHLHLCAE